MRHIIRRLPSEGWFAAIKLPNKTIQRVPLDSWVLIQQSVGPFDIIVTGVVKENGVDSYPELDDNFVGYWHPTKRLPGLHANQFWLPNRTLIP